VAYWRLGEASGTTAVDETGSHNGTYVGSPTLGVPGALVGDTDTAVDFDGVDDYISVPYSAALAVTSAYTIEFWANLDTLVRSGYPPLVFRGSGGGGTNDIEIYIAGQTKATVVHNRNNGGTMGWRYYERASWIGETLHVVLTWDGTDLTFYVNGAVVITSAGGSSTLVSPLDTNRPWQIAGGTSPTASPYYVDGRLDEVAIYDTALSATRVAAHYDVGTTVPPVTGTPTAATSATAADAATGTVLDPTATNVEFTAILGVSQYRSIIGTRTYGADTGTRQVEASI